MPAAAGARIICTSWKNRPVVNFRLFFSYVVIFDVKKVEKITFGEKYFKNIFFYAREGVKSPAGGGGTL